jgi:leucyl-tRNA synthetase
LFLNIAADLLEIKRLNYFNKQDQDLKISESSEVSQIVVFTTRPDTIYGVTAIMLAPEVTEYDHLIAPEYKDAVLAYRKTTAHKTAVERQQTEKEKS